MLIVYPLISAINQNITKVHNYKVTNEGFKHLSH